MIELPFWFVVVPVIVFVVMLTVLIMIWLSKTEDRIAPLVIIGLPLTAFFIPYILLVINLWASIPWFHFILIAAAFLVPFTFLIGYIASIRANAPEAIAFKKARELRKKGKIGDVGLAIEGNDVGRFGLMELDEKNNKICYKTENYGLKINPGAYQNVPCIKMSDGVRLIPFSPMLINPTNGTDSVCVSAFVEYCRKNHPIFDALSDLELTTLACKRGEDLEEDAHRFLKQILERKDDILLTDGGEDNAPTVNAIVDAVKAIQKETSKEIEFYPSGKFVLFRKVFEALNCAYTGSFLQDHELVVRQLERAKMDRFKDDKIFGYAAILATVIGMITIAILLLNHFIFSVGA